MNSEIKQKWLEALRSDEYQQGDSWLRKDDKFCCLGVLCDIYVKETNEAKWLPAISISGVIHHIENSSSVLPLSVQVWSGLVDDSPYIKDEQGEMVTLASLNDSGQYTFLEIANMIEAKL